MKLGTAPPLSSLCSQLAREVSSLGPGAVRPPSPLWHPSPAPAGLWPLPTSGAYKKNRLSSILPHTGLSHSLSPPLGRIKLRAAAPFLRSGESCPPLWHVGPRPWCRPRAVPLLAGQVGRLPTRSRVPVLGWAEIPPAQLAEEISFLFPFSFPIFIYMYIY